MAFQQYYKSGNEKFYNLFQALDHHKKHSVDIEYVFDPEFISSLQHIKKPRTVSSHTIKELMVKGLRQLRKKHNKIRLAFGGGTDSWTILKLCVENNIYIDELVCGLVSFVGNVRTDLEYLPGVKYARAHEGKTIGKVQILLPTKDSLEFVNDPEWFRKTNGPLLPIRPFFCQLGKELMNDSDKGFITITGLEKPTVLVENGRMYWTQMDIKAVGEWMGIENHYPLFYDKDNPELTVAMTYGFIDTLPKSTWNNDGVYEYETVEDRDIKDNILDTFGMRLDRPWLNHHNLGKKMYDLNIKTEHFIKEVKALGMQDYLDKWYATMEHIYSEYKDIPYSVEPSQRGHVKTVGRFCQKIPILPDAFGKVF
jgi:hypothetical protein|tara:strand:+ start:689 stop:1789 length:1101 start_codon:yes stop_codon:yes gene_type:complete